MMMQTAYLAYNPAAGRYPSRLLAERAADVLRQHGWKVQTEQTQSGEHLTQLAKEAAAQGMDAFFVVGGDGSLNRALQGLLGSETALAVLPAGTANVWAQELGLPGLSWTRWMALEESAKRLANGRYELVDVGLCNQRHFLLWAGVGLDAFIVHRLEPRQRWEKHFAVLQYAASAIWNAAEWRGMQLEVTINHRKISGQFMLAVISNIRLYAGGFAEISPQARLDDGEMDLWLFEGETLADTVQIAWELLSGSHQRSEQVEHIPFRSLRIDSASPLYLQVDGEKVEIQNGVEIEVLPRVLKVLTPKDLPKELFRFSERQQVDAK